jgi:hypothetical protein
MFSTAVADSLRRSKQHTTTCSAAQAGSSTAGAGAQSGQAAKAVAAATAGHMCAAEVPADVLRPVTVLDVSGEVMARPVQVGTAYQTHNMPQAACCSSSQVPSCIS